MDNKQTEQLFEILSQFEATIREHEQLKQVSAQGVARHYINPQLWEDTAKAGDTVYETRREIVALVREMTN
jgi:hypothetical protein